MTAFGAKRTFNCSLYRRQVGQLIDNPSAATPIIRRWIGWSQLGIGALKELGSSSGELKSMRTHPDHLRQGIAALLLDYMITDARARGWKKLSLETGTGPAFEAALKLS